MKKDIFGVWEIVLAHHKDGTLVIPHNTKVKVSLCRRNEPQDFHGDRIQ
jgi:hypothetical protein